MKHAKLLSCTVLLSIVSGLSADVYPTPTYIARSQGSNAARKMVGLSDKVHLYGDESYVNLAAQVGYAGSTKSDKIAKCLFGDDVCGCEIKVQGSNVDGRDEKAWLADYFYLAPDYDSTFKIRPQIQNATVDLDVYIGLDNIRQGMYFRAYGPIAWSKWNLNFDESCDVLTTNSYTEGYFDVAPMKNSQLLRTFGEYAQGKSPINPPVGTNAIVNGTQLQGLQFARIERCARSRTGFADLRLELGSDFAQSDDYHFGLNVQVAAPTGSKRQAMYAFDPVIGNGNHWEVGGGLTAHYTFWRSQDAEKSAGFYLDANITHINNGREERTFDLRGRPNSRYMLAQKLGFPLAKQGDALLGTEIVATGAQTASVAQFTGVLTPVANLTTLNVNVRASVQADVAAMFNYTSSNWGLDLGYNFWIRSCEKIGTPGTSMQQCCPTLCGTSDRDVWALKGDARVYGYSAPTEGRVAVPLSATQCGATIHKGTNAGYEGDDCLSDSPSNTNCGVDNAQFAVYNDGSNDGSVFFADDLVSGGFNTDVVKTSIQPKFINCCDINFQRTRGVSHKIFGNLNYTFDRDNWVPYVGFGASAEFGKNESCSSSCDDVIAPNCDTACEDNTCCPATDCIPCIDCSLSQWAVWVKGGVSFN